MELHARIGAAYGRGDNVLDDGEVVESFFNEETDDPVGVEDKIGAGGVFVSDHTVVVLAKYVFSCELGYAFCFSAQVMRCKVP